MKAAVVRILFRALDYFVEGTSTYLKHNFRLLSISPDPSIDPGSEHLLQVAHFWAVSPKWASQKKVRDAPPLAALCSPVVLLLGLFRASHTLIFPGNLLFNIMHWCPKHFSSSWGSVAHGLTSHKDLQLPGS